MDEKLRRELYVDEFHLPPLGIELRQGRKLLCDAAKQGVEREIAAAWRQYHTVENVGHKHEEKTHHRHYEYQHLEDERP